MITFRHRGSFANSERFLSSLRKKNYRAILEKFANEGLSALRVATPEDSGRTANSWDYEIVTKSNGASIYWTNSNIVDGVPVAILIQYGHGTRSGTFVQGRDYINPVMRPIFDKIAENLWKEVTSL